jgi:hypothetical protein
MLVSAIAINAAMGISASGTPSVVLNGIPGQTITGVDLNTLDVPGADNAAMSKYWGLVRDIVEGTDAMRAGHNTYLPKFPNEDDADYDFRWKNAKFTNVYRDIIENLASKPFEQEVTLITKQDATLPEAVEKFIEDVDGAGNHITTFAIDTFFNGINNAIDWVLIDYPNADQSGGVRSVEDEKRIGVRPYWTHILASDVLMVRSKVIAGKERLVYVRLREVSPDGTKYIRIMRADETLACWELYREVTNPVGDTVYKFEFFGTGPITINEIPMTPFVTGRRIGRSWRFNPVMKDAADLQVELFQQESALKNLETLSGFPMLSGNGVNPQKDKQGKPLTLKTGPQTILYGGMSPDGQAGSWEWIVPPAELLKFLLEHIRATIDDLRELGRNPLTAQSGNLTVVTTEVAAQKGNSAVQMWAFTLKNTLENAMVITNKWLNIDATEYDPEVSVYTDFTVGGQSDDVANLINMRKNRDISLKTFWHEMVRRGVLSGEFKPDQEEEQLLNDIVSPEGTDDPEGVDQNARPAQ